MTAKHTNRVAKSHLLAWQGLTVPMREEWRPLRTEGDHRRGTITVGDMNGPIFQLRWLRPAGRLDGADWIDKRCSAVAGGQTSAGPPQPAGFDKVAWIESLAIRQEAEKTVWWGYSKAAGLVVEVLLTNLCDAKDSRWFVDTALPKLNAIPPDRDCPWRIYSLCCVVPPFHVLTRSRLVSGDIALEFAGKGKSRLLVRQIFPGTLALQRRTAPGWLRDRVFTEHRRFRKRRETADSDRQLHWSGWKNLPFPLGFVMPRRCEASVVHDTDADRLLIVESVWPEGIIPSSVESLLDTMRWSRP